MSPLDRWIRLEIYYFRNFLIIKIKGWFSRQVAVKTGSNAYGENHVSIK